MIVAPIWRCRCKPVARLWLDTFGFCPILSSPVPASEVQRPEVAAFSAACLTNTLSQRLMFVSFLVRESSAGIPSGRRLVSHLLWLGWLL